MRKKEKTIPWTRYELKEDPPQGGSGLMPSKTDYNTSVTTTITYNQEAEELRGYLRTIAELARAHIKARKHYIPNNPSRLFLDGLKQIQELACIAHGDLDLEEEEEDK
jgi:hypothetical protein